MPVYEWKCDQCKARGQASRKDDILYRAQSHLAKKMEHTITAWRRGKKVTAKRSDGKGTWRYEHLEPWAINTVNLGPLATMPREQFWAQVDATFEARKQQLQDMRRTRKSRRV
jgi:hypothetical protein